MYHTQEVMKLFLKLMLKVIHAGNAFHSPDGDTTDVLTACVLIFRCFTVGLSLHMNLRTTLCEAAEGYAEGVWVTSWSAAQTWLSWKFKKTFTQGRAWRRKKRRRAPVTVRPLPVVTSRGCEGFKRRQLLLLLLHPLSGRPEDCEVAGQSSLKTRDKKWRLR